MLPKFETQELTGIIGTADDFSGSVVGLQASFEVGSSFHANLITKFNL